LLGYFVYRSGYLVHIPASLKIIKKAFSIALVIAVFYLIKKVIIEIIGVTAEGKIFQITDYIFSGIGVLSLSLVYCTTLIFIFHKKPNLKIFKALSSVGMMSLTNYVSQTLFYCFFFYGFGLSMLGKMHMQWVTILTIVLFTFQILGSMFWMKRFRFGPAEWIWRMLSYNKHIPIKK
jgi:uncharacterized protein